jgi:phage anti-repressor protein
VNPQLLEERNLTGWNKRMLMDLRKVLIIKWFWFSYITRNGTGGNDKKDYALTIDTAKKLSMLKKSRKGKAGSSVFY